MHCLIKGRELCMYYIKVTELLIFVLCGIDVYCTHLD